MDDLTNQITRLSFELTLPGPSTSMAPLNPAPCYVDKLPSELISWIAFWVVSHDFGLSRHPTESLRHRDFARVCRTWRNALLGAPYLWTCINAFNMLEWRLLLSKSLPLDIYLNLFYQNYRPTDLKTLALHRDRWRRISIAGPTSASECIIPYLKEETPSLRHLCWTGIPWEATTVDITSINTPRLENLRVTFQVVHMAGKNLANLRALHLTASGYSPLMLNEMLAECISLSVLTLEKLQGPSNRMVDQSVVLSPITLPSLTRLEITGCANSIVKQLLPSINTPALQSWTFLGDPNCSQLHSKDVINEATVSVLVTRLYENQPWTCLPVEARVDYLRIGVPDVLDFKVSYRLGAVCQAVSAAIAVFQLDNTAVALQISLEDGHPYTYYNDWGLTLGKLKLVSLTSSHIGVNNLKWLCDFLSRSPLTCPNLTRLEILLEDPFYDGDGSIRDVGHVIRGMMRCRPEIVAELKGLKILVS